MGRGSNGAYLAEKYKADAQAFAETMRPLLTELILDGSNRLPYLAGKLNAMGIPSRNGGRWYPASVSRVLKALGPSLVAEVKAGQERFFDKLWAEVQAGRYDKIKIAT
ncbi:MAG: hypothetical protein EPO08_02340 [Rhodospirillaceae bacterium]|nr:MAG: hypothetical protein EPO08_02340 [Rhodospirillaceae bacterium]